MAELKFEVALASYDLLKKIEQIRTGIKGIASELDEQGRKVDSSFFKKVFTALDGTKMLKSFVGDIIETRKEMERLGKTYEVLLGSKEKAESFSNDIKNYALNSTLSVSEISEAAQTLLEFNVSAEDVIPTLQMLGDVSMGDNQRFASLALTFGQISEEGKLTGEYLSQLTNEGFNPLEILAEKTGRAMSELTNEMAAGKISVEMVADAFDCATTEGGKFHGMMEKGAGGIIGAQNRLQGAIQDTLSKIGEENEELIKGSYDSVTFLVKNYDTIGRVVISLIATYGAAKAALILYDVIKAKDIALDYAKLAITGKLDAAMKALNLTMLKNPYVLAAALIVGVAMAMWTLADHTTAAEKAQERYNKRTQEANDREQERKNKLRELLSELEDTTTAEVRRVEILDIIKGEYPAFFKFMLDEQGYLRDLTDSWKAYNEETEKNKVTSFKQKAEELKKTIAEEKRYLELRDMGMNRGEVLDKSDSDRQIWNKYLYKGTYNIRKDLDTNTFDLFKVEKDITNASFNQWKVGLKEKSLKALEFMNTRLKSLMEADNGNKYLTEARSKYLEALKAEIGFKKEQEVATKDKKYWEQQLQDAQKTLYALSDVDAGGDKGTAIKEKIEGYKIKINAFETTSKSGKKTVSDPPKEDDTPLITIFERQVREQIRGTEDMWNDIYQTQIDAMDEGSKKALEQMEFNHEKRLQAIDREKEDLLQKKKEEAEIEFNKRENKNAAENSNYKRKTFDTSLIALSDTENKEFNGKYKVALEQQANDTSNYYKTILEKYQDFSTQRLKVEEQYDEDIAILQARRTTENSDEIDRAILEAQKKKKEATQQIDDTEVREMEGSNDFLKNLYGDYSQMRFEDLRDLISEAKQLQSYLSGSGNADELKFITKEQLSVIEKSPAGLANLRGALDKLLQGGKKNPWDNVFDNFSKGLSKLKASKDIDDISEAMKDIGGAASEAAAMLGGVAGSLSQMFEDMGNTDAADAMSTVQDAMGAISNIGEGFSKGGIIGGIGAAVGEAANFIGKAFAANARHKEALEAIMNEATSQQRAYNLLLLEQNLLYEKGTTILGADVYGKAKNAVLVMKDALADLNNELAGDGKYGGGYRVNFKAGFRLEDSLSKAQRELYNSYAGLANIQIKTGHKKTGMFGWGRGKDIYSSILDVYPELIDQNGKFNASLAETIMNTRTMSDTDKAAFQNMINLSKQAEEALQVVKDYLSDIFGDLGDTMSDALVDAFKNGSDAAQAFTDSVSNMLEDLAKQMVYSVTLAPIIEKAQKQMLDVMQNTGLSDEQKFQQWTMILGELVDNVVNEQEYANSLYEEYRKKAAEKGFDILGVDESSSQSSSQKGFAAMSQDTGEELNGRFTALQMSNEEIKNSMLFILGSLFSLCTATSDSNLLLTDMRNLAIMSNGHLEDIAKYTKVLLGFGEKLDNIDRNTKNI